MASRMKSVLVIGGGIAGLGAAEALARSGWRVTVLEARDRLGGRIHTVRNNGVVMELGAEFLHGRSKPLWDLVTAARLRTQEVPDKHWQAGPNGALKRRDFWAELAQVFDRLPTSGPDESFARFLDSLALPADQRRLVIDFVEGFDAARVDRISAQALAIAERAAEQIEGDRQFRLVEGYGALVEWLAGQLQSRGAAVVLNAVVQGLRWKPQRVEAAVSLGGQPRTFTAEAAVITLPLGVLRAGAVRFEPPLPEHAEALAKLEFGSVTKVVLRFRSRFWPEPDFGFIHAPDEEWLPTWWSDERADILTGWAGGPKGERLAARDRAFVVDRACEALAKIFGESPARVRANLVEAQWHNWSADPFARGAYSYIPAGGLELPRRLAQPVAGTLFFAGEATIRDADLGTVHGALETGQRAARELSGP